MLKKILIENLTCSASIGVYENEKLNKQKIIINLEIFLINKMKTHTDNLNDVADYGKFRRIILDVINSKHFNLIETLADNLIKKFQRVISLKESDNKGRCHRIRKFLNFRDFSFNIVIIYNFIIYSHYFISNFSTFIFISYLGKIYIFISIKIY